MNLGDLYNRKVGDSEAANFIDDLYKETKKQFLKQHRDWYINERFVRGEHWIVYNRTLNQVEQIPIQEGEIRRTVNKIRSQIRGVKNFIKKNQPRWETTPEGTSDEDLQKAQKVNKLLQSLYRRLDFPHILTDVIVSGLKYSVGVVEGGVVTEAGESRIKFWHDDTFDIYFDPFASSVQDCRYIIKTIKKPLEEVKNNPNYTIKGELRPDKNDERNYKELLDREKHGGDDISTTQDLESITVKEFWVKYLNKNNEIKIKVFTVAGNQLVRVYSPNYRRYPFFIFNPEREPNSIYSDAWVKDLISSNKSLDKAASQIEGYIERMLAGKYLIKQGVETTSVTDKGAEKIYYKGSTPPAQMNLQPLPSTPFVHTQNLERWIEEMGGIREASLGRLPSGAQSGEAIEALQAADAQTVAEPIENLQKLLEQAGEFVLELISDHEYYTKSLIEEGEKINYIGNKVESVPENTIQISPASVKVTIVPEVAYSEEAKFNRLIRMAENGLIDKQTVLEKLSLSNVSQAVQRMQQEQEEEYKREMAKQSESHRQEGEAPQDTADLADQENKKMAAGQPVNMTPRALWTPEHLELHMAFIQQNPDAYQQNKELFDDHIQNEENYQ